MENLKEFKEPRFPSFRLHKISTVMGSRLPLDYMETTETLIIQQRLQLYFAAHTIDTHHSLAQREKGESI